MKHTVEQKNVTTGKSREFLGSGRLRQENFANLWLDEFHCFNMVKPRFLFKTVDLWSYILV